MQSSQKKCVIIIAGSFCVGKDKVKVVSREKGREKEVLGFVEKASGGMIPLVKEAMGKFVWCGDGVFVKAHKPRGLLERLKQFFLGARAEREFKRSLEVQNRGVRCANVVGYVVYRRTGTSYLVVQAEKGVDIGEALRCAGEVDRQEMLRRLAVFVRQMHAAGVLHGDLHPGNIISHNNSFCLLDTARCCFKKTLSFSDVVSDLGRLAWGIWTVLGEEASRFFVAAYWGEDRAGVEATLRRAQQYGRRRLRSRSKRCVKESTGFCRLRVSGWRIISRRKISDRIVHWLPPTSPPETVFTKVRTYLGPWGALRVLLGFGRLYRGWKAAHKMDVCGVPVVKHLGYARRLGLIRTKEILFMERAEGNLQEVFWRSVFEGRMGEAHLVGRAVGDAVRRLLLANLWFGDMKVQNLLMLDKGVCFGDTESLRRGGLTDWRVAEMLGQLEASLPRCLPARGRLRIALEVLRGTPFWERRKGIITRAAAIAEKRRDRWASLVARKPIRSSSCESSTSTATTD